MKIVWQVIEVYWATSQRRYKEHSALQSGIVCRFGPNLSFV